MSKMRLDEELRALRETYKYVSSMVIGCHCFATQMTGSICRKGLIKCHLNHASFINHLNVL